MSDYSCFNCNKSEHTYDLLRVEWKGLVTLLCHDCINRIFVKEEQNQNE